MVLDRMRSLVPAAAVTLLLSAVGALAATASPAPATPELTPPAPTVSTGPRGPEVLDATAQPATTQPAPPQPAGDPAATLFVTRCAGCHTIGGGKLTGPDLAPATQWPDVTLRQAIQKMEPRVGPISDTDLAALIAFARDPSVKDRIAAERDRAMQAVAARLDPPSIEEGHRLFTGQTAFQRGGLACAACHTAGGFGGSLGPDLTPLAGKMDRIAMMSAFEKAQFILMREAYANAAVTRQEALHLAAYFESLQAAPPEPSFAAVVPLGGAGLAAALLALLAFTIRGRRAADVRSRLLRDSMRR